MGCLGSKVDESSRMVVRVGVEVLQVVCTHGTGRGEVWHVTVLGPLAGRSGSQEGGWRGVEPALPGWRVWEPRLPSKPPRLLASKSGLRRQTFHLGNFAVGSFSSLASVRNVAGVGLESEIGLPATG